MKRSRFTDSQIIAVLKQAESGTPVPNLCREHGISSATFYKWRSKYGGMDALLMTRALIGKNLGQSSIRSEQPIANPIAMECSGHA